MEAIAKKSYVAVWTLTVGLPVCAAIICALCRIKTFSDMSVGDFIGLAILCLLALACIVGLIFELKRPNILITKDGETLHIYCRQKWQIVNIEDITSVKPMFQNGRGYTSFSFGTLIIATKAKLYKIYNVADVKNAWVNIENIIRLKI